MRVVIDRQDGVGFDGAVRQEAVVEAVAARLHDLTRKRRKLFFSDRN